VKVPGKVIGACLLGMLVMAATVAAQDKATAPTGADSLDLNQPNPTMFFAQGPMGETMPMPPGGPMSGESFENQRKHLEQLRLLKMLELLDLSKEQEIPFLTAFNATRQKHDEIEKLTRERVDALASGIEAGTLKDSEIYKLVDDISASMKLQIKSIDEFLANVRGMLTAEQYGKLVIFHMRFEVEMLEQLGRFRESRRQGQGQGRGPHGGGN
jgi:hypothetical protein